MDGQGTLVSYYKFIDNPEPNSTKHVATPDNSSSVQENTTLKTDNDQSVYKKLEKLKELFDKKLITQEEYDKERQELLDEL